MSKNTELLYLDCDSNNLTFLDVSKNLNLFHLNCPNNQIRSLDLSNNAQLSLLNCSYNNIPEIELPAKPITVGTDNWITLPQYIFAIFINDEEIYDSIRTTTNTTITAPKNPVKNGFAFDGWYDGETKFYFYTRIRQDIVLTAKWIEIIDSFTVVLVNNGKTYDSIKVKAGETMAKPTDLTEIGLVFAGWYNRNDEFDFETIITENITLTAKWITDGTPINKPQKSDSRFGIKFAQNIVSDKAEISVVLPNNEKATQTKLAVYDAIGNKVFESEGSKGRPHTEGAGSKATTSPLVWNLTNNIGRTVANGTYLVIAEVKGQNGMNYYYSAKLGVKR